MMKKGRKALVRLRRLAGQMGLTSGNCRKVMTACVQSVAMYGMELWWKGEGKPGMRSGVGELQKLVNQEARAVTGCFRTTNLGALAMESRLRPAAAQLDNRQRRFAARLLSLPVGSEAKGIVGAQSAIGSRLETAIGYSGRMEEIVIASKPEKTEAVRIVEDRERAIEEAKKDREGLTIFTDGSRLESGATGYAVAWKAGNRWVGVKAHMGYNQEAFDAECAALARALEVAAKRQTGPKAVTIFTDSQAAMARIASEEPGPAQQYAQQARKWITKLRGKDRKLRIELRWCPAHSGVAENEEAGEWAKKAAEESDAQGVEWMTYEGRYGRRPMPLPRSLANLKREIAERKWEEAWAWSKKRVKGKKYQMPKAIHQNSLVTRAPKRLAERYHQLRTGHCRTGQYLKWTKNADSAECGWCRYRTQTREHLFKNCERWKRQQKILWAEVRKKTQKGKDRVKIRDLFADERCTGAILEFLRTTEVGKRVGPRGLPPKPVKEAEEEAEG
jgi:ribonuclease HI